jgi:hypothetical protein
MRSIFSDYYIGSLLWKAKDENVELLACENLYGYAGKGSLEYVVLDGQHRLTAMYYAFVAPTNRLLSGRERRFTTFPLTGSWLGKRTPHLVMSGTPRTRAPPAALLAAGCAAVLFKVVGRADRSQPLQELRPLAWYLSEVRTGRFLRN